jgi:hypothetical protein
MTVVINLWAGPGAGKSTTAAGLFFQMKHARYKCELVTEYAKELCYFGNLASTPPLDILKTQIRRQEVLRDKVDYIITDSPILLSCIYNPKNRLMEKVACNAWESFTNINFFIDRTKKYDLYGRTQSEDEALKIDEKVKSFLNRNLLSHYYVPGDKFAPFHLMVRLGMANEKIND